MDAVKTPIIIKRVKKVQNGHHGGAWKVAFADFVTAMMAFFMLMWLMGSTTAAQKAGISQYFKNPSAIQGPGGASTSMIKLGGTHDMPTGSKGPHAMEHNPSPPAKVAAADKPGARPQQPKQISEKKLDKLARERDKERLKSLLQDLKKAINASQALKPFKDQLLIDITSEGLRIQIVDKENRPMFAKGSAVLEPYTKGILDEIAKVIAKVPNKISITGHTDKTPYSNSNGYSNWELSADRANAARRELVAAGLPVSKVGRVVGLASSVLFDKKDPFNPINRRISIIVMNKATEEAMAASEAQPAVKVAPAVKKLESHPSSPTRP